MSAEEILLRRRVERLEGRVKKLEETLAVLRINAATTGNSGAVEIEFPPPPTQAQ